MVKIKKVKVDGATVYPATIMQAVKDPSDGKHMGEKLAELGSNIIIKSSFGVASLEGQHFLSSVVASGNVVVVSFQHNIYTFGDVNGEPYSYAELQTKGKSYTIPNVYGLVVDLKNGNIEVVSLVASYNLDDFAKANKILLCANVLGKLISPIASFQAEISYIANDKPVDSLLFGGFIPYFKPLVIGGINTESGKLDTNNNMLVATNNVEVAAKGQQIKYSDDIYFMLFICDSKGKPISSTGWLTTGGVYTFDADCYYKLQYGFNPLTNISNVEDIRAKVQIDTKGQFVDKTDFVKSILEKEYSKIIVVAKSGGDFYTIREAVESVTDASENNRYKILVKNGVYHEIDIRTKDFVDIEGESKEGVILYANGQEASISPSNYNFSPELYSGVPINSIPKAYKHLFLHISNSKISNLTMVVYYCKYVIHQDGWSHEYDALVENCVIRRGGDYNGDIDDYDRSLQYLVGVGAFGGQYQRYVNCEFQQELINLPNDANFEVSAVLWHNWNEQTKGSGLTMKDCSIYGCSVANIIELGSGQQDIVELTNCISNNSKYGVIYDKSDIAIGDDYCIKINVVGGNIPFVLLTKKRLNGAEYVYNPLTMERVVIAMPCQLGTAIAINGYGNCAIANSRTKDFAFLLEDSSIGTMNYINKGMIGYGLAVCDNYNFGDTLYLTDKGMFTKLDNGNAIGICLENISLSENGLLKIGKSIDNKKTQNDINNYRENCGLLPILDFSKSSLLDTLSIYKKLQKKNNDITIVHIGDSISTNNHYASSLDDAAYRPPRVEEKNLHYHIAEHIEWKGQEYRRSDAMIDKASSIPMFNESGYDKALSKYYDEAWDWQLDNLENNFYRLWTRVLEGSACSVSFVIPKGIKNFFFKYRTDYLCSGSIKVRISKGNDVCSVIDSEGTLVEANDFVFNAKEDDRILSKTIKLSDGTSENRNYRVSKVKNLKFHIDDCSEEITVTITNQTSGRLNYWGVLYTPYDYILDYINVARGGHNIDAIETFEEWDVDGFKPDLILLQCPIINEGAMSVVQPNTPNTPDAFANRFSEYISKLQNKDYHPEILPYVLYIGMQANIVDQVTGKYNCSAISNYGYVDVYRYIGELCNKVSEKCSILNFFNQFDEIAERKSEIENTGNKWISAIMASGQDGDTLTQDGVHLNDYGNLIAWRLLKPYFNF